MLWSLYFFSGWNIYSRVFLFYGSIVMWTVWFMLTYFISVLLFIRKPVIWFVLQNKKLVSIWNATLGWNGRSKMFSSYKNFSVFFYSPKEGAGTYIRVHVKVTLTLFGLTWGGKPSAKRFLPQALHDISGVFRTFKHLQRNLFTKIVNGSSIFAKKLHRRCLTWF